MQSTRRTTERTRSKGADKVTNGRLLAGNVDLRSAAGRRFRHLVAAYTDEIGGDLSEAETGLVRQAAAMTLTCERVQADIVRGVAVDHDSLTRLSSEIRRLLGGIKAKGEQNKPAGPTLAEWLATQAVATADEAEAAE